MSTVLVDYYLENYPKEAAELIDTASKDELVELMLGIKPALCADVLSHLLPATAHKFLTGVEPSVAASFLQLLRAATISTLTLGMKYSERKPIFDLLPSETRLLVAHQLKFPPDSIGSILIPLTPACRQSATIRDAKKLVRRLKATEVPLMTVVDQSMRPVGLLDFGQIIRLKASESVESHMRKISRPLRARTELSACARLPAWSTNDFLPAVAEDEHFVGMVSKSSLFDLLSKQREEHTSVQDVTDTILHVADSFWRPAAEFVVSAAETKKDKQ